MFTEPAPRLFALPPGVDFAQETVAGLRDRMSGAPPQAMARVLLIVNTARMARRIREVFDAGPPSLMPRVTLIGDLAQHAALGPMPAVAAPLRRRLELSALVAQLLDSAPAEVAPRRALFDLTDSLAALIEEMQAEGVAPEALSALDVSDHARQWSRTQDFLSIVATYLAARPIDGPDAAPDAEALQRHAVLALTRAWARTPPPDPVIVAGSTGSRGTTALLIDAVARLPNGAVILPGFDFDLPQAVWDGMEAPGPDGAPRALAEDHPQFRFRPLMRRLGLSARGVRPWTTAPAAVPQRNALLSLALRPAPVTDQWRSEGPRLGDLAPAADGITLVEAPGPRAEADAIALGLRAALAEGKRAALVTPDRALTRQVAAALDRWRIKPDDSAGQPLHLSPPGRLLRQAAALLVARPTGAALLSAFKHPLTQSGGPDRGPHLRRTRDLELHLRRNGPPQPGPLTLTTFAERGRNDPGLRPWADWGSEVLRSAALPTEPLPLTTRVAAHIALTERLAAGTGRDGSGALWDEAAGRAAQAVMAGLTRHADAGHPLDARDYANLVDSLLRKEEVRDPDSGHPGVLIWGTLEARVQGADLVILAGLNDGTWPEPPAPDPWLNRAMRADAGLLSPERRIGLSAHDFMQAAAGAEIWLTRAIRSDEAETVPSRWLNRLTNLMGGLPGQGGVAALAAMRARGADWAAAARRMSNPEEQAPPAPRPSPRPPLPDRPDQLPVTRIETLIRDPYAIYAERILGLRALDPLTPRPDARLRGEVLHKVLERFVKDSADPSAPSARAHLMRVAEAELDRSCPWPTMRRLWLARIGKAANGFIQGEAIRRARGRPAQFEEKGSITLPGHDFLLTAQPDRIDLSLDGTMGWVYDYKTGSTPTAAQQKAFSRQLLLEAAMMQRGAFAGIGAVTVGGGDYIGLGPTPKVQPLSTDLSPDEAWDALLDLISDFGRVGRGYTARRAMEKDSYGSDYDHLSRHGEWDVSDAPVPEDLT